MEQAKILLITGLSGAGLSSSLKVLEDLGYEVFDNFPIALIDVLLKDGGQSYQKPIAIGVDTRTRGFNAQAVLAAAQRLTARLVFITCDEDVLQKRFSETRRRHPLAADRPVSAGIKREMAMLHPLKMAADPIIDTTDLTIHGLKRLMHGYFEQGRQNALTLTLLSFGFKNGLPREADIVMDVRFLKNPHWEDDLRPLTGQDKKVQQFIQKDLSLTPFLQHFKTMLEPLLDRYRSEGKSYLTIALGCTGGKHRSVYMCELMGEWARARGISTTIEHRDMNRI